MDTLTLAPRDAKYLADGMMPVAKAAKTKESWNTTLAGAQVSVLDNGTVRAVATDRYRVHLIELPQHPPILDMRGTVGTLEYQPIPDPIFLPVPALQWLITGARFVDKETRAYITIARHEVGADDKRERITLTASRNEFESQTITFLGREIKKLLAPVHKLFATAHDAPDYEGTVVFNAEYMAQVSKLAPTYQTKASIRFTKDTREYAKDRPGAIVVSFPTPPDLKRHAEALVMPNWDSF